MDDAVLSHEKGFRVSMIFFIKICGDNKRGFWVQSGSIWAFPGYKKWGYWREKVKTHTLSQLFKYALIIWLVWCAIHHLQGKHGHIKAILGIPRWQYDEISFWCRVIKMIANAIHKGEKVW